MRYTKNDVLPLEPEHEQMIFDDDSLSVIDESVYIRLDQLVHNPEKPYLTYWEVTYMTDTSKTNVGETRVLTENIISTHEIPEVTESSASQQHFETPTKEPVEEQTYVYSESETEESLLADPL